MFGVFYLQSSYSMLKNAIPLPVLVEEAKRGGYDFIALADENLHGMLALFQETKKQQIKPVLGMKIKAVCDLMETGFLVYVKNQEGFQNLLTIQKQAIDKKMLSLEDLATHQSGLIFITSGSDAIIDQLVLNQDMNMAKHHVLTFKSLFESFYIGLSLDTFDSEMKIAPKIYELSEDTDVKMLPLHQTSYLSHDDKEVYEALIKIADEKNEVLDDANYAFQNQKDLKALFADYPFVFDTAKQVVSQIDFIYQPPHFEMPSYPLDEGIIESEYLRSLATIGLKKRLKKVKNPDIKIYQKRLIYELSVIHKMGYDTYFLIVFDFVRYAKMNGILVGPGRGSAAGSLVAYCLGITDVDSIAYDLLFERFLNPERMSMPDIDMDFPDNRRDEVIEYVKSRYGETHIVSITTFGTFALRSSIRDIARVMKIDNSRVAGIISRVIKNEIDTTDYEMVRLLKVAKAIEGLPRHTGTHPAGMILAKQNLTTTLPLQKGPFSFYQSQLEAKDLESMGLLKIDFLGIRNLTVIDEVIRFLGEDGIKISLLDIDLNDEKTYQLLSNADTSGVFQLESQGMRATLRKLKPNTFEDLVALLALYRPGPMDHIDEYIDRRNGKSFTYLHTKLKPILEKTYGIIIYQEQIMQIASEFAGYTLAEADLLRRGISKKDKQILQEERIRFVNKCRKMKESEQLAEHIYDYIVKFADYGFNRSHSVAYTMVAYQMAYLKANHFAYFMTVLLSSVIGNESLTKEYINETRKQHIRIVSPHINQSTHVYQYIDGGILLPLLMIRSIGSNTVQKIIDERKNRPFENYQDFKYRLKKDINEKNLEMLIHSGALDVFNLNRKTMSYHKQIEDAGYEQYISDFHLKNMEDFLFSEKAELEKEALGFNLLFSPLQAFEDVRKQENLETFENFKTHQTIEVLAYAKKIKIITTKQGKTMAFITLDDGQLEIEATLFQDAYQKYEQNLSQDIRIYKIRLDEYRKKVAYVIESIRDIKKIKSKDVDHMV